MSEMTEIDTNLYGIEIKHCSANLSPQQTDACFFIVNKTFDVATIQKIAIRFLKAGCREIYFHGKAKQQWHNEFDIIDIKLNPEEANEEIAMTVNYDSLISMANDIEIAPMWAIEPTCNRYILYDDEVAFQQLITFYRNRTST